MTMFKLYRIPIAYLLLYVLAILATGLWLFLLSQGLQSSESILTLLKEIAQKPETKSLHNFVEVAMPHMFAMGTMVFVLAHFMLFSTNIREKHSLWVAMILYGTMFLNIFAYLLIIFGVLTSGWIKLLSLALFLLLFLLMLGMVLFSL